MRQVGARIAVLCLIVGGLALGSGPADASVDCSAAPISVTHDITLSADLTCGANDAFHVLANGVTIDLNHHTVTGSSSHLGAVAQIRSHVVVKNGTFAGFGTAVEFLGGSSDVVSGIHAFCGSCSNISIDLDADHSIAKNNFVYLNARAIQAEGAFDVVKNNVAHENTIGIYVTAAHVHVTGNRVVSSTHVGIVDEGSGTALTNNIANGNGTSASSDGIDASLDQTSVVKGNTADYNTSYGIDAYAGATDAGGNSAKGNSQFAQCFNVVCT